MKRKICKLLWCIIISLTIINLLCCTIVRATQITTINTNTPEDTMLELIWNGIGFVFNAGVGIISKVVQLPFLLIGMALQGILTGIASLGGSQIEGFVTPDDVFFNRVALTDINFFDISNGSSGTSVVEQIRINIATWYYILRIFAVVILLAILIYVGIRMAISTVASEQAQYKRMLTDWVISFALIFLLSYIILFTLEANNGLVQILSKPAQVTIGDGVVTELAGMIAFGGAVKSWGAFIVYWALIGMSTAFVLTYIKRMLTIGFLIIISPLITITYSIDKMKDGSAQALNTWLKEFMFNVLIQPFHCIIYLVFISSILNLLGNDATLAKMILAVVCMKFIWTAEKIVKQIFGFHQASSLAEVASAAMTVHSIANVAKKVGGGAVGAVANHTQFGKSISRTLDNSRFGKVAKTGIAAATGTAAAAFEMGLGTQANAAHVGAEAFGVVDGYFKKAETAPGSRQQVELSEKNLQKYADLISRNNNLGFQNFRTDRTSKNNLKAYAESLIGTNMDMLNSDIQNALNALRASDPANYDVNTATGAQHLKELQDMALNDSLDFNDPSTNPLGHAWTAEEKQVITAIQIRNLATAVNSVHQQYTAAGRANPNMDVSDYIEGL